jgi:hypothetical protein
MTAETDHHCLHRQPDHLDDPPADNELDDP